MNYKGKKLDKDQKINEIINTLKDSFHADALFESFWVSVADAINNLIEEEIEQAIGDYQDEHPDG